MKKQLLVLVFMLCLSIFAYAQNNLIEDSSAKVEDGWIIVYPYFIDFEFEEVHTLPYGWDAKRVVSSTFFSDNAYVKTYSHPSPIWQEKYLYARHESFSLSISKLFLSLPKITNPGNKYIRFNAQGHNGFDNLILRMVSNYSVNPSFIDIASISCSSNYQPYLFKLPDTPYNIFQFYRFNDPTLSFTFDASLCLDNVEIGIIPEGPTARIYNTEIDFERHYQGTEVNIALPILNIGSEPLIVNATSSEHFSLDIENITIPSVEQRNLSIILNTESPGYYNEQIIINTNDQDNPQYIINCTAEVAAILSYGNLQIGFDNELSTYPFGESPNSNTAFSSYAMPNEARGRISALSYDYAQDMIYSYYTEISLGECDYSEQAGDVVFTECFAGTVSSFTRAEWITIQLDTPFVLTKRYLVIKVNSIPNVKSRTPRYFYFSGVSENDSWLWSFNFSIIGGPNIAIFCDNIAFKKPENFDVNLDNNIVNLSWVAPIYPDDIEDLPVLSGYNVYRNDEIIATLDETQLSYTDNELDNSLINTYYLTAVYTNPEGESMPTVKRTFNPTGIEDVVNEASLSISSYPNPVKDLAHIALKLHNNTQLKIEIFNIKGQKIKTLYNEECKSGDKLITWDTKDDNDKLVSSGVYFYKVSFDNLSQMKKMLIMR